MQKNFRNAQCRPGVTSLDASSHFLSALYKLSSLMADMIQTRSCAAQTIVCILNERDVEQLFAVPGSTRSSFEADCGVQC